jgi:hypothetical protein
VSKTWTIPTSDRKGKSMTLSRNMKENEENIYNIEELDKYYIIRLECNDS